MQISESFRLAFVMSVLWALAAGNAGMHLAVAPVRTAYRSCLETKISDNPACLRNLNLDWEGHSGNRIRYAALAALVPLPLIWLAVYAIMSGRRETKLRAYGMKVFPANP
jgi:hypothetical protein